MMATLAKPDAGFVTEMWHDVELAEQSAETARRRFLKSHDPRHWQDYLEADRIATEARHRAEDAHKTVYSA